MGTSTSNSGQNGGTPLVPSWLTDEPTEQNSKPEQPVDPKRFMVPRRNFTRFINSGDGRSLSRATSGYVRNSLGGAHNAAVRLGEARNSTARMLSLFNGFATHGVSETQRKFQLGDIIGKPADEAFLSIMEFVCPDGGSVDEGIARDSYIDAIAEFPDMDSKTIDEFTPAEFLAFMEMYMTNVIEGRLINDIGNKLISLPNDIATANNLQEQIKGYIRGSVSDAVAQLKIDIATIDSSQAKNITETVYREAYEFLAETED